MIIILPYSKIGAFFQYAGILLLVLWFIMGFIKLFILQQALDIQDIALVTPGILSGLFGTYIEEAKKKIEEENEYKIQLKKERRRKRKNR